MFSPRLLAIFALVAAAVAVPAIEKVPPPITTITETDFDDAFPWYFPFGVSSFKNLFTPFLKWFPSFDEIGPKVIADENNFQVIINAKGYNVADLKVKVKGDYIIVKGSRESKHDDHDLIASEFIQTFNSPVNTSVAELTAELTSDGYLVINAPINAGAADNNENVDRDVKIVETGKPLETKETKPEIEPESNKEPTTGSPDREEVTESNNDIPHGTENEINP